MGEKLSWDFQIYSTALYNFSYWIASRSRLLLAMWTSLYKGLTYITCHWVSWLIADRREVLRLGNSGFNSSFWRGTSSNALNPSVFVILCIYSLPTLVLSTLLCTCPPLLLFPLYPSVLHLTFHLLSRCLHLIPLHKSQVLHLSLPYCLCASRSALRAQKRISLFSVQVLAS